MNEEPEPDIEQKLDTEKPSIPSQLNPGLGLYDIDPDTAVTNEEGDFIVEKMNNEEFIIMHPKGDHEYSLIWLMGFNDLAIRHKDFFVDKEFFKTPEGCRIIIPTPPKRFVKNFGMDLPGWFN
jgi:hypothetical protein